MSANLTAPRPIRCVVTVEGRRWRLRTWPGPPRWTGPPILLIHGLGATPAYFRPLAERLAAVCPTIAPSLPGFGGTDRRRGERSIAALATAVAEYWAAAGTEPALVVGHSLGAQIVTSLAARYPDLVAGVALVSPAPDPFGGDLPRHAARLVLDATREPFTLLRLLVPRYLTSGLTYLSTTIRAMDRYRWEPDLPRVAAPALVLRGERDPVVSRLWATTLARDLPAAHLIEISNAPHGVIYS
ncbi:MAG: alpha/beta fold hydrolase, partial [Thermomicrobiales bacterium]